MPKITSQIIEIFELLCVTYFIQNHWDNLKHRRNTCTNISSVTVNGNLKFVVCKLNKTIHSWNGMFVHIMSSLLLKYNIYINISLLYYLLNEILM